MLVMVIILPQEALKRCGGEEACGALSVLA